MNGTALPSGYFIEVVRSRNQLIEHLDAWDDLSRHAAEPNVFYESWALLPALRQFGNDVDLRFILIYLRDSHHRKPQLCGFFPLERSRPYRFLPVTVLQPWRYEHCYLCTPILRAGHSVEILEALFDWLRDDPSGAALLHLDWVSGDEAFAKALTEVCYRRRRPSYLAASYSRALITPRADHDSYLRAALSGLHLKHLRRNERTLGRRGRLEWRVLAHGDDVSEWGHLFLDLEASGWKGAAGTAMKCVAGEADYFVETISGAFAAGQLEMLGLFLDDRPVAMKCNLLSGNGSFAFKIAFDEGFASSSPGMLLEVFNVKRLHEADRPLWMDSCAIQDHPVMSRLWLERRIVVRQFIATGRAPGDLLVALQGPSRWVKRLVTREGPRNGLSRQAPRLRPRREGSEAAASRKYPIR